MLAADEITITVAREAITLRPTLRAAMRLERAFGGFDKLIEAIDGGSVTAMAAVIRESSDGDSDVPRLIEGLADMPLHRGIEVLKEPLVSHVLRLAGHDGSEESGEGSNERITFAEHHARLYRLATGWLGWSPETAWTSTASEIIEAYAGRIELLQAIFGTGTKSEDAQQHDPSPELFNAKVLAFARAMGTRKVAA